MKPVLIFTADKAKDNITFSEVKKKILSDTANKIKEENEKEIMDYGPNTGRISPSKMKIHNGSHIKNLQMLNGNKYFLFRLI